VHPWFYRFVQISNCGIQVQKSLYKFPGCGVYPLKPVLADGQTFRSGTVGSRHSFEMNFDLETLYEAKAADLILYGRALGLSHGEAEDVLQETFLALLKMVGGGTTCQVAPGKLPLEPEHYCVRSFRNRALNHRRSLWRRLTRELEVFADGHHWFEKSSDETEQSMQTAAVDCLAELPVEQREAIVLKIWHGFTFEQIGGLLGISPNTAAGRYRYGLQKIKRQLKGIVYGRERDEITGDATAFLASAPAVGDA
jgi:RNA polymerase sigma-70 factor (ECF subfamily)